MPLEGPKKKRRLLWQYSPRESCEAFDKAWRAGNRPRAEDHLGQASEKDRPALLYGLLAREVAARRACGESLARNEFDERFPEDRKLVDAALMSVETVQSALVECGFEFDRVLAQGRTGDVYLVRRAGSSTQHVCTVIPEFFARFDLLEESSQFGDLDFMFHKNIARPIQFDEVDRNLFMFSELVQGKTLQQLVTDGGPLPIRAACEVVRQVAVAVGQLHSHHRIHGALTPANVIVCTDGSDAGLVKLTSVGLNDYADLWLARFAPQPSNQTDWNLFLPPDAIAPDGNIDPRVDIYSLGCALLYLLLGRLPNRINLINEVAHFGEQPPESGFMKSASPYLASVISEGRADVPRDLEATVARMLSADSDDAYGSALEVAEALKIHADEADFKDALLHSPKSRFAEKAKERVADTLTQQTKAAEQQLVTPNQSEKRRSGQPRNRMRFRLTLGTVALCILLVAAWLVMRNRDRPQPEPKPPPTWAATLVELPGPTGDWWFEETPWFGPGIRAQIQPVGESKDHVRGDCEDLVERIESQSFGSEEDLLLLRHVAEHVADKLDGTSEGEATDRLLSFQFDRSPVADFREQCQRAIADLEGVETVTGIHLRAVLRHYLSEDTENADRDYNEAIRRYQDERQHALLARCTVDYARFLVDRVRDYNKAIRKLDLDELEIATPALRIEAICQQATAYRKSGRFDDALDAIRDAKKTLAEKRITADSALNAIVLETEAWVALDRWDLLAAEKLFSQAIDLRNQLRQRGSARSKLQSLWNRQGLAMVRHFLGDQKESTEMLEGVSKEIKSSIDAGDLGYRMRELMGKRLPNVNERLGDCYLFGPSANSRTAVVIYQEAINYALEPKYGKFLFDIDKNWPHIASLRYKLVLAYSRSGKTTDASEALKTADDYVDDWNDAYSGDAKLLARNAKIFRTNQLVAKLIVQAKSHSDDQARFDAIEELYRRVLEDIKNPTRKQLNTYLLAAEFVAVSSYAAANDLASMVRRVDQVVKQLNELVPANRGTPYFQRYANKMLWAAEYAESSLGDKQLTQQKENFEQLASSNVPQQRDSSKGAKLHWPVDEPAAERPRLHILTVGVSEYSNPRLNLQYAHKDAQVLRTSFEQLYRESRDGTLNELGLFARGHQDVLVNHQVTRRAIFEFVDKLIDEEDELKRDFVIMSFSGHAIPDRLNQLHFLCHDYDATSKATTAIELKHLQQILSMLATKVLLIYDCCHSGEATNVRSIADEEVKRAWQDFAGSGEAVLVLSASLAREKASESANYAGHGALTAAVLEYIGQKHLDIATRDKERPVELRKGVVDNALTLDGLRRYVIDRIRQFKGPEQNPSLKPVMGSGDFSDSKIRLRFVQPKPNGQGG